MRTYEYVELTDVSKEDLANAWADERGVKYSADKKRLLNAPKNLEGEYTVLPGTEVICDEAFNFVMGLTKVILPEGLKSIGGVAFGHCGKLKDINIPSSVEFLGECIRGQRSLAQTKVKSFTFPKSLEYITPVDGSIFYSIPKAEEYASESPKFPIINGCLIIDNTLVCYLGKDACAVIPDGVTSIGVSAFFDCKDVTTISIPSSVTEIGEGAFNGCSSLQSIEIPDSVTKIGIDTFGFCHSLQSVVLSKGLTEIPLRTFFSCEKLESVIIPDSVTMIGNSAFWNCNALSSIDIPASVTSIGKAAFCRCESLQTINIQGTPQIGESAFDGCPGYKE